MSAPTALRKAHALAIERLAAEAPNAQARSSLNAVSMKLETLEEAESGTARRLTNAELVGTYAPEGSPGGTVTIVEDGGHLLQRVVGFPDAELVLSSGNRYQRKDAPEGSFTSFRVRSGKTELLVETPFGIQPIRAKQD